MLDRLPLAARRGTLVGPLARVPMGLFGGQEGCGVGVCVAGGDVEGEVRGGHCAQVIVFLAFIE
jgi:hypothetical protein